MKTIPIVFSSDTNYLPYLSVSIQSIIDNANSKNLYKIYILTTGIEDIARDTLLSMTQKNISIEFIDINNYINNLDNTDLHIDGHISVAAYFRLFIPDIFTQYKKILYADCDVIFMRDIADLFNIPLGGAYLAAVPDIGLIYYSERYPDPGYYRDTLGLDSIEKYFNSGILVYNLDKIRKSTISKQLINTLNVFKQPRFHDQCILNKVFCGHIKFLPMNWNYWGNFKAENPNYKQYFPKKYINDFENASRHPYCIHYKPWLNPYVEYAYLFWEYARKSPFYEIILYKNICPKTPEVKQEQKKSIFDKIFRKKK